MEHKTRTKVLSWLLSLALALSLIPASGGTALAYDNNPYADLVPTGSEDASALTAKQVTFNGKKWYVINDESTAENAGTLTLLYAGSLVSAKFDETGSNNYANSSIKTALGRLTADGGYYARVAEAINDSGNGKLYLLSKEEAEAVPQNVRAAFDSAAWWLRTQGNDNNTVKYVFVNDTVQNKPGRIVDSGVSPTVSAGVRPALQLDLSKVVYVTADKAFYIPATAPTISSVTGATLVAGYGAGSVSVTTATAADGHTLSYQWYQNTTNSNEGGTLIENATSATYNIPTGNAAGVYYYYCVVTATRTDNSQTASATSDVATVTVAADTDALVAKLAEEKNIDLSQYYLISAENMYFTSKEYWNFNSSWEKLPDEGDKKHVATKQFTKQGLPKDSVIFCRAYYAFEAVAWESINSNTGKSETIGKRSNLLTKISDQFDWWDTYSFFGFNLTKYVEGDFNTKEEADLSSIGDAFRIYVPKPADAAEVNGTEYPTVADAIRAAGEGDTVKLLRDVTENVVLRAGTNIVLDLNGHTLTNDGRHCTIVAQNGSTLVVTGNGTVDNTTHGCAPLFNNGGTVTLNGGTFIRSVEDGNANGGNTYYTVVNHGTMTINEGVTVSNDKFHYSSLIANGYNELTKTGYREIDPKVSNGYVEGENAANPTLTINGGTFTGGNQALKNDVNGIAMITGGSFSSTDGNAIKNLGELTISDGTFTANAEGKFALLNATESGRNYGPESVSGTATVTGGTFNGKLQKDEGATISISGGQFSEIVPEDCCAEGYEPSSATNNNNRYTVIPQGGAVVNVAIVGVVAEGVKTAVTVVPAVQGATYKWFRDDGTTAISDKKDYVPTADDVGKKLTLKVYDAEDNEIGSVVYGDDEGENVKDFSTYFGEQLNASSAPTIKLDGPVSGPITIPADKEITLDLNGKTVTDGVTVNGKAVIKDTAGIGGINGDITIGNGGTLTVKGGTFSDPDVLKYIDKNDENADVTVKLSKNETLSGSPVTLDIKGKVTFDLNGHTLTGGINVGKDAEVTIKPEGTITGSIENSGKLNINGGTFNGDVTNNEGGTLNINGGTLNGNVTNSGKLTVNGGTFNGDVTNKDTMTVNGGTFASGKSVTTTTEKGKTKINGGTFKGNVTSTESGKTTIKSGQFDNKPTASTPGTVSIEGGKFKADPTGNGVTLANGKQIFSVEGKDYPYQVADKPNTNAAAVEVSQGVTTGTVDTAKITSVEDQTAATSAATSTTADLVEAAVEHAKQIVAESTGVNDSSKNIVIVPALEVKAEVYTVDGAGTTMTLDIEATYISYKTDSAITSAEEVKTSLANHDGKAEQIGSGKLDTTGKAVEVKIGVPALFAGAMGATNETSSESPVTVFVKHTHESKNFEYQAKLYYESGNYFVAFTNPNGFSPFTLSKTSASVVTVTVNGEDRYYTDIGSALNDIPDGETLTLTKDLTDEELAAVINSAKEITINKGTTNNNLSNLKITAGSGLNITKTENSDGTVTFKTTKRSSGGSSSSSSGATYSPTVSKAENGTVNVSPTSPKVGDKVTVTPKSNTGYEIDTVTVTDASGKTVSVTKNADGTYTFTQPSGTVKVDVTFKAASATDALAKFNDISASDWYADAVRWALDNGVMNGVSRRHFNPDGETTRAMIATMLWRLEGSPVVSGEMKFVDVAEGTWYTEAIRWAASVGIISGSKIPAETTPWPMGFRPNDAVTREQLAAMLYRYGQYKKADVSASADLGNYGDAQAVSGWAASAMQWAVGSGIINGISGNLVPAGEATRAQVATMLMRYSTAK